MSNKIKIAFYLNMYLKGGVEKSLIIYLNGLDPNRFEISLIINHYMANYELSKIDIPKYINIIYINKYLVLNKVIVKRLVDKKLTWFDRIIESIIFKPLRELIYQYKIKKVCDYDFIVDYALGLRKVSNTFKQKLNLIGFLHFDIGSYYNNNLNKFYMQISNYKKIICITDDMLVDAKNKFPVISDKFELLYNQFDFEAIQQKALDGVAEFEDNLAQHPQIKPHQYILSISRLDNNKDFPTLLRAYSICVLQMQIDIPLVILGDGIIKNDLIKLAEELEISHMVYFLGFKYNPYTWLKNAKIFILSSKHEGFGLVLVEAMITKVPVISTNCPTGPRGVLLDGDCGILCSIGDEMDMAKAIMTLYNDQQQCQELVTNANNNLYRFDIKRNISILEDIIKNI
jgi:glycosyltransferase involved in cell wall biosynthesis